MILEASEDLVLEVMEDFVLEVMDDFVLEVELEKGDLDLGNQVRLVRDF